ncbi:hypothetical protein [Spirosoma endophyticum]|uniref:Uncharacterized protein n=1 Tax=Spirosoma endophyticum TaxID=662367 RepID=A0A1I2FVW5_9BACT|nr:hypothetical protein [Spirosoma endophyticum]SFF09083.1 hypothetical protein SAMN05216167_1288 [Spirosoma endophyticum]
MGMANQAPGAEVEKCQVTGLKASYDFDSKSTRYDGLEYQIKELNPHVIIRIPYTYVGDDRLKNGVDIEVTKQRIHDCKEPYYNIDFNDILFHGGKPKGWDTISI